MKLTDKVVLVTASTRGIGLSIAQKCVQEGAQVYLAARDLPKARKIADEMIQQGGHVQCVFCDATKPESFGTMVDDTVKSAGRIDVLVNNFGTSDPKIDLDLRRTDVDTYLNTVTINLRSVFLASQAAVRHMHHGGSIINISSVGGLIPDISQIGYGTGKAAINHLTKLIALQEAHNGIRCNAVLPGMTATDAVQQHLSKEFKSLFLRHIPLGRMGLPEEVAAAVCYLASDESAYVTGQILTVSGGFGLGTPVYGDLVHQENRR